VLNLLALLRPFLRAARGFRCAINLLAVDRSGGRWILVLKLLALRVQSTSTDTEGAAEEEDSYEAEGTLQQSCNRAATELQPSCNSSVMRKRSRSPFSPTDARTRPPPAAPPLLRQRPAVQVDIYMYIIYIYGRRHLRPEVLEARMDR
jgi:hypothetical protein